MSAIDEATRAVQDALGPERPLSALPADIREQVVELVTEGLCSAAQAAEALAVAVALGAARNDGEINDAQGFEVMVRLGVRHRDGGGEA